VLPGVRLTDSAGLDARAVLAVARGGLVPELGDDLIGWLGSVARRDAGGARRRRAGLRRHDRHGSVIEREDGKFGANLCDWLPYPKSKINKGEWDRYLSGDTSTYGW
jgi:hypothetical protein